MRKIIFIMGTAILGLCMNACKTQHKVSESTDNSSVQMDLALAGKYWKLVELYGKPVIAENNSKEPHIIFKIDGKFNGNAGCNNIMGSYRTKENYRISLTQAATTMMMCLNMDTETQFLEVINKADSYIVKNDTLTLNRARMAPLARFVAVYME